MLTYIKKVPSSEVLKERMDRIEKNKYKNKISKVCLEDLEDLEHFTQTDLKIYFMIDLFKYSSTYKVLESAYNKFNNIPHILMINELISKPKLQEKFLIKILEDYTHK